MVSGFFSGGSVSLFYGFLGSLGDSLAPTPIEDLIAFIGAVSTVASVAEMTSMLVPLYQRSEYQLSDQLSGRWRTVSSQREARSNPMAIHYRLVYRRIGILEAIPAGPRTSHFS
jgi:hypothetical protein